MTQPMKINEAILDELENQAHRQSKRNYKAVEVDCRTLLAILHEIRRSRMVELRFERPTEPALKD